MPWLTLGPAALINDPPPCPDTVGTLKGHTGRVGEYSIEILP